ncbi:hypothetical protein OROMI_033223 [Orobanche minor]
MTATTVTLNFQPLPSHSRKLSHPSSIPMSPSPASHFVCAARPLLFSLSRNSRNSIRQARAWGSNLRTGMVMGDYGHDDDDGVEEEEEDEDRSLDLLIRFVENVFRKVSRKARKAVKSVLPVPISTRLYDLWLNRAASIRDGIRWSVLLAMYMDSTLVDGISEYRELIIYSWLQKPVGFAVNGTLILTFLWILKAFLEKVICNLGSVVFASILLIRGIWTGITYFQEGRGYRADDDEPQSWTRTQPAI